MSKNHHYVPQSSLRGFSIDGAEKQVMVFDKLRGTSFPAAVADAGAEMHFNTLEIDGTRVNLEGKFQDLDDRLADLLRRLREHRRLDCLSAIDREHLAHLAVIQLLRVKQQRTSLVEMTKQLRAVLESAGSEVSETVLPKIDDNTARAITFRMLSDASRFVPDLLKKHWVLHTAPAEFPFWISDCPVVTINVFPYGDSGLSSPGVQVCWPLSRDLLISFLCPTVTAKMEYTSPAIAATYRGEPVIACSAENMTFCNSLQVLQSSRFLYGPTADFSLAQRILKDHPEAKQILSRMSPTPMGEMPRREQMPPGTWLVVFGARTHHCCPLESWSSERGQVRVTPAAETLPLFERAVADAPHSLIEIYENGSSRLGMRDVTMLLDPAGKRVATIRYADPALDQLATMLEP